MLINLLTRASRWTHAHFKPVHNHYQALGLQPNATIIEIKKKYYELAKLYHPDVNKNGDDAKFRSICTVQSFSFRHIKFYLTRPKGKSMIPRTLIILAAVLRSLVQVGSRRGTGAISSTRPNLKKKQTHSQATTLFSKRAKVWSPKGEPTAMPHWPSPWKSRSLDVRSRCNTLNSSCVLLVLQRRSPPASPAGAKRPSSTASKGRRRLAQAVTAKASTMSAKNAGAPLTFPRMWNNRFTFPKIPTIKQYWGWRDWDTMGSGVPTVIFMSPF